MPDVFGPFDSAPWAQAPWYRHAPTWAPSGVIGPRAAATTSGDLPLTINGLTVSIGLGRANVRGAGYERTGTPWSTTVPANTNATLSRIDRLVLRRDLAAKTVVPVRLQGTPAATPVAPALTQDETGVYDVPLFRFRVQPASSTVLADVTDERVFVDAGGDGRKTSHLSVSGWTNTTFPATQNVNLGTLTIDPKIGPYVASVHASAIVNGSAGVDATLRLMAPGPVFHAKDQVLVGPCGLNPSRQIVVSSGNPLTIHANLEVLAGSVTTYADATHSYLEALVTPL